MKVEGKEKILQPKFKNLIMFQPVLPTRKQGALEGAQRARAQILRIRPGIGFAERFFRPSSFQLDASAGVNMDADED